MTYESLASLPSVPARRSVRYVVRLTNGETFTVLCHRGSVPQERVGSMLAHHESVKVITVEDSHV